MATAQDLNKAMNEAAADLKKKGLSIPIVRFTASQDDEVSLDVNGGAGEISSGLLKKLSADQLKALIAVKSLEEAVKKDPTKYQLPDPDAPGHEKMKAELSGRVPEVKNDYLATLKGQTLAAQVYDTSKVIEALNLAQGGNPFAGPIDKGMTQEMQKVAKSLAGQFADAQAQYSTTPSVSVLVAELSAGAGGAIAGAEADKATVASPNKVTGYGYRGRQTENTDSNEARAKAAVREAAIAIRKAMPGATIKASQAQYVASESDVVVDRRDDPGSQMATIAISQGALAKLSPAQLKAYAEFTLAQSVIHENHVGAGAQNVPQVNVNDGQHQVAAQELAGKDKRGFSAAQQDIYSDYLAAARLVTQMGDGNNLQEALKVMSAGRFQNFSIKSGDGAEIPSVSALLEELKAPPKDGAASQVIKR